MFKHVDFVRLTGYSVSHLSVEENTESDIIGQWLTYEKPLHFFVKVGPLKQFPGRMIDISRQLQRSFYWRYLCFTSFSQWMGKNAAEEA